MRRLERTRPLTQSEIASGVINVATSNQTSGSLHRAAKATRSTDGVRISASVGLEPRCHKPSSGNRLDTPEAPEPATAPGRMTHRPKLTSVARPPARRMKPVMGARPSSMRPQHDNAANVPRGAR